MSDNMLIISFDELCESHHIQQEFIIEIVDYGIAKPISGDSADQWQFETASVPWLKKAIDLYTMLEMDWFAVAMIIELLKQKEALAKENTQLKRRLER
ncbi:chaperone modulatory protein CbpM [Glaciecola sp. XM2]|jgi:chaperone modulatory protein CbpM|uniref:chaperone modulator CbpM n=1 Tax=Glaciecola sp. XM2 TaxID=1914931 RepID=UPI001BDE078E|nr:chaperone modulator CbpM [Glaciecola sp. XM2]MBT1450068.1 chaperone modulatory protein CbpM [Glaciecola sp. XM2]